MSYVIHILYTYHSQGSFWQYLWAFLQNPLPKRPLTLIRLCQYCLLCWRAAVWLLFSRVFCEFVHFANANDFCGQLTCANLWAFENISALASARTFAFGIYIELFWVCVGLFWDVYTQSICHLYSLPSARTFANTWARWLRVVTVREYLSGIQKIHQHYKIYWAMYREYMVGGRMHTENTDGR